MKSIEVPPKHSPTRTPQLEEPQREKSQETGKNKGKLSPWLIAILFLGGGVTLWQVSQPSTAPIAQTRTITPSPRAVETISLTSGARERQVQLLGQVEAGERSTISPQIDGTVERVLVREGDRVTPGMTVAILDDADPRLALAQAKARLAQERSNLERLQVGTRPEIINQRQAELRAAQAREREAEANLESLTALQPSLIAQRRAELSAARVRAQEAQDNLQRIRGLSLEGALSQRALVEAQSGADATRSEVLRAEAAVAAQETQSSQNIAESRTRLDNARSNRLRIEAVLAEAKAGPTREVIAAQQGVVNAAQAAVEQAELALERTQIRASFAGIVQSRDADPGDYLEVNDPILTVVSDRSLDIFLEIPENLSGQVTPGMTVNLTARALPNWQETTTITAVVPTADTASRRQLVRVSLDNPPQELLPGMAIQGNLAMAVENTQTFIVPRDALTRRGDSWLLFAVNDNQAQQLEVEMITDLGEEVVIANSELVQGQAIVVKGGDGLRDNAAVQVVSN